MLVWFSYHLACWAELSHSS